LLHLAAEAVEECKVPLILLLLLAVAQVEVQVVGVLVLAFLDKETLVEVFLALQEEAAAAQVLLGVMQAQAMQVELVEQALQTQLLDHL
jgi:hypothetical protein